MPAATSTSHEDTDYDDQQLANSAISQIVSFENRIRGQVPQDNYNGVPFNLDHNQNHHHHHHRTRAYHGHVRQSTAQSRAFTISPQAEGGRQSQQPFLRNSYPASILNNAGPLRGAEWRILNTVNNRNPTPLPKTLPSVTQSFYEPVLSFNPTTTSFNRPNNYIRNTNSFGGRGTSHSGGESVVVKVVPAYGFYLNDPKEKEAYFEAVSRGLLDDNGFVYVNKVQQSPVVEGISGSHGTTFDRRPSSNCNYQSAGFDKFNQNCNYNSESNINNGNYFGTGSPASQPVQHVGNNIGVYANNYDHRPFNQQSTNANNNNNFYRDNASERPSIFAGSNSYSVPINSVGRLENDIPWHRYSRNKRKSISDGQGVQGVSAEHVSGEKPKESFRSAGTDVGIGSRRSRNASE